MPRHGTMLASALLLATALAACSSGPQLPEPAELDPTLSQVEGYVGGVGGTIHPGAGAGSPPTFALPAGTYVLRAACASTDGSEVTLTVELEGADPVTHVAACGTVETTGFSAIVTESEPFESPGGDAITMGTAAVAAVFNAAYVRVGD